MNAMRVADTSFLYALFSEADEFHERAARAMQQSEPITIPSEILSETVALIHYRQGFDSARAAGEWLWSQPHVEIGVASSEVLADAWRTFTSARGRLSYPDSIVVAWSRPRGAKPLAYDTRILAIARK